MIGSLEVMHKLIFTIASVVLISRINSINSIWLKFDLGKPGMNTLHNGYEMLQRLWCQFIQLQMQDYLVIVDTYLHHLWMAQSQIWNRK